MLPNVDYWYVIYLAVYKESTTLVKFLLLRELENRVERLMH